MRDPKLGGSWSDELTVRVRIEEARPFASLTSPSSPRTTTVGPAMMPPFCEISRSSSRSLASVRSLAPEALIVLFTPVLVPSKVGTAPSTKEFIDPFESLGQALSEHHKRIRHVPYVPKVGLTKTHVAFVRLAGAVVVVTCEAGVATLESLKNQRVFADRIAELRQDLPEPDRTAFALAHFGDTALATEHRNYGIFIQSERYYPAAATEVANMMFAPSD